MCWLQRRTESGKRKKMREKKGAVVGVVGTTGTGKTTTLRKIINRNTNKKFVVYGAEDSEGQYILGEWQGKRFVHYPTSVNMAEVAVVKRNQIAAAIQKQRIVICNQPGIDELCQLVVSKCAGVTLVIDELDACREIRRTVRDLPIHWTRLISKGRHISANGKTGVSLLWACQKMSRIHQDILDECKALYLHKLTSEKQRKRVQEWLEFDTSLDFLHRFQVGECIKTNSLALQMQDIYNLTDLLP